MVNSSSVVVGSVSTYDVVYALQQLRFGVVDTALQLRFCKAFNNLLWDDATSIKNIIQNFTVPMTSDERSRFVDLSMINSSSEVVGSSSTYIRRIICLPTTI